MPVSGNLYYSFYHGNGTEKPPLVLIHGAGGMHLYWPAEIRRLPGYCVYAIDLPGHGKSEGCDGQQTIEDYSRHIIRWLDAIHLRRAVLIGHSMGGAIAMDLAIRYPKYVLALGLIGTGARLRVHPDVLNYIADLTTFYKATNLLVSFSFGPNAPARLVELALKRIEATRQSVLYGDLLACNCFDVMDSLGAIGQNAMVICGADDQMTPVRYAQYLVKSIPNAQLSVIPNAGHMVLLEQPSLVADRLLSFLGDISFRPGEGF
jgi:pimeloyl-ACP methyl ester carboxylesterase